MRQAIFLFLNSICPLADTLQIDLSPRQEIYLPALHTTVLDGFLPYSTLKYYTAYYFFNYTMTSRADTQYNQKLN